ncbi:glycosyltransferase family 4 protein [Tessaracoccus sp. OS52]|uniref:glycosyltransferase family 4 protein n=1 Tax=Tessaracoccus sp. OS52 TaxID=2886691 RepID=UPI001D0FF5A8|nr:glycosyltransferase family 4 protein [Tessaracoccus sp. OS52]MCC2594338.1 glycosyltransferase family 4 protein [Tessaracoccus sp. OS52]
MKLGLLSQWYDPETGPASLPGVYAREFSKQGHEVRVLTGFPNYPDGKLYPGYSLKPRLRETHGDVEVTRVALYPNHSHSAIGRALNYASFGLSATALGSGSLRGVDAIWVYNSPVTVAAPMLAHSKFGQVPVFLHVQDLWPDSLVESGMFPTGSLGQRLARVVAALVRLTERKSAVIGVISEGVRDLILERNPDIDPSKVVYVPNPTNEELFRPVSELRSQAGIEKHQGGPVEVLYAGAIGEVQGLDVLIDAASSLMNRPDIRFTLVGDGISRARLEARAKQEGLTNVTFTGRVPQDAVPGLMARADIQLVSLASRPFLAHTTPSKIPSLLASEVPILAALEGDGANMIKDSGGGIVVPPGSADALAAAIRHLADAGPEALEAMGRTGRTFYMEKLSARAAASKITKALDSVMTRR